VFFTGGGGALTSCDWQQWRQQNGSGDW